MDVSNYARPDQTALQRPCWSLLLDGWLIGWLAGWPDTCMLAFLVAACLLFAVIAMVLACDFDLVILACLR